jgi:hypothetical protein
LISRRAGICLQLALTVAVVTLVALLPRTAQPLSYHEFADRRGWLGIANFLDVASNIVFAAAGLAGLWYRGGRSGGAPFIEASERWFYVFIFLGRRFTALGSSYYHLAPDNARLVWDRLPMTVVFMSLVAAVIAERMSLPAGLWLLPVLLGVGISSVLAWYASELRGRGDLRFYAGVQAYAVLVLLVALLLPPRYTRGSDFAVIACLYVVAKICESADRQIYSLGHFLSGHTPKHLTAGVAGFWILRMLENRQPIENQFAR